MQKKWKKAPNIRTNNTQRRNKTINMKPVIWLVLNIVHICLYCSLSTTLYCAMAHRHCNEHNVIWYWLWVLYLYQCFDLHTLDYLNHLLWTHFVWRHPVVLLRCEKYFSTLWINRNWQNTKHYQHIFVVIYCLIIGSSIFKDILQLRLIIIID